MSTGSENSSKKVCPEGPDSKHEWRFIDSWPGDFDQKGRPTWMNKFYCIFCRKIDSVVSSTGRVPK